MGALSSSDSGISSSNIQNKIGLPAPISQTTLSPEELLHQQKVFLLEYFGITKIIITLKPPNIHKIIPPRLIEPTLLFCLSL